LAMGTIIDRVGAGPVLPLGRSQDTGDVIVPVPAFEIRAFPRAIAFISHHCAHLQPLFIPAPAPGFLYSKPFSGWYKGRWSGNSRR
jgi:hypothetical protein